MFHSQLGLIQCDKTRATPGYTIYSPLGIPKTYLVNMAGDVVHQWDLPGEPGNYCYLLPNGNLLASVRTDAGPQGLPAKGGHMMEMDWDGNILWQHVDPHQHHDFRRMENGNTVYVRWELMEKENQARVGGGRGGSEHPDGIWGDVVREISPTGSVVWEWRAEDTPEMYDFPINPMCPRVEWCHCNAIWPLAGGDVLVNFRYNHLMGIIDRETKTFKWTMCDYSYGQQHGVSMLDDGHILFFANGANVLGVGPEGGSRVVEIDPADNNKNVWQYRGSPPFTFFSWFISNAQRLSSGNTLILEGLWGRIFEVTPDGGIVWEYVSPHFCQDHPMYKGGNYIFRAYRYAPGGPEIAGRLAGDGWG